MRAQDYELDNAKGPGRSRKKRPQSVAERMGGGEVGMDVPRSATIAAVEELGLPGALKDSGANKQSCVKRL